MLALIIVSLFFATFLGLVIVKDFYNLEDLSFSFDWLWIHISIGPEHKERAVKVASFLVDFATLPLVAITLMFTAHSGYGDSKMQRSINNMSNAIDVVEGQVLQIIAQQKVVNSNDNPDGKVITKKKIPQTDSNSITKDKKE